MTAMRDIFDGPCRHHDPAGKAADGPGRFAERDEPHARDYGRRAFTVGIGGPVGSGKTALLLALCRKLRDRYSLGVVTNDIFTKEDGEFLVRHEALETRRITAVETGGCPHTAVRDDVSQNLDALQQLMAAVRPELLFVESGGDNLAAQFSRELADFTIYVIDVSGGDKIPRKGGPGITQSDLLVINKTDIAELVGSDLDVHGPRLPPHARRRPLPVRPGDQRGGRRHHHRRRGRRPGGHAGQLGLGVIHRGGVPRAAGRASMARTAVAAAGTGSRLRRRVEDAAPEPPARGRQIAEVGRDVVHECVAVRTRQQLLDVPGVL